VQNVCKNCREKDRNIQKQDEIEQNEKKIIKER
jgi:hypothetical protein